ncbi:MAG: AMP-binding protein [Cytophagaceae bacterium]|nr:AMP-binding protein [Cytophagaceae bacterium]
MLEYIYLNHKKISLHPEALLRALDENPSPNEKNCLQFLHRWVRGDQEFEQFTSGSTGPAKRLLLKREQMIASAKLARDFFSLTTGDHLLCCLGIHYIGGKMMLVRALVLGIPIVVLDPVSRPFQHLETPVSFTSMVPMQMMTTLTEGTSQEKQLLASCSSILLGGASISQSLHERLKELTVPVFQSFATSESASFIAMRRLNGPEPQTYYQVLPGIQISTDQRGALVMKGAVTDHQAIITNDIIELKNEHEFRWIGRADFVINSGGIKIFPESVEAELSLVMNEYGNPSYLISSLKDELLGEKLVLCISRIGLDQAILKFKIEDALPRYLVPKLIVEFDTLPVLKNGKPDRLAVKQELEKRYAEE